MKEIEIEEPGVSIYSRYFEYGDFLVIIRFGGGITRRIVRYKVRGQWLNVSKSDRWPLGSKLSLEEHLEFAKQLIDNHSVRLKVKAVQRLIDRI